MLKQIDLTLVGTVLLLVFIGLLIIYDASVVAAFRDFGDKLYYFKNQLVWACVGLVVMTFFSFFDYHKLLKFGPVMLLVSAILLIAVLIPGIGSKVYGARRWIYIAGFNFQPSEIAKLALIMYETAIISKFEKFRFRLLDSLVVILLPALFLTGLVVIQPDLGTALIFAGITIAMYFIGGAPIWHFLAGIPFLAAIAIGSILLHPYRLARVKSFLDPTYDPQGASYQINQILIAVASGGLFGVGIGASRSKFTFIPEVQNDAIFAVVIEELGFVGALFILSLFLFLIYKGIKIAQNALDFQGKILAMGIISLIAIQTLFNLASIVALVPLTGIPLPFISYGGSSLLVTMASIGILVNIAKQNR